MSGGTRPPGTPAGPRKPGSGRTRDPLVSEQRQLHEAPGACRRAPDARDRADRTRQITRIVAREIPTAGAALTRGAVARLVLQRQAYNPRPQALGQRLVRPPARGGAIPFKQLMATFGSAGAGR